MGVLNNESQHGYRLVDFIERNAILDDDGHKPRLILARLRKTHKAEWYRRTNGQMEQFAVGHTAEVAANHYADIPALRPLHEQAVADGFRDALDAALAPRIILPEAEARPPAPDPLIYKEKTNTGTDAPFTRHFYVFEPPRPLEEIDADLKACTDRIKAMIEGLSA